MNDMDRGLTMNNTLHQPVSNDQSVERKTVGVIIPVMGNKKYVLGLLPTIRSYVHDIRIIVIDNGSKDNITEDLTVMYNNNEISHLEIYPEPLGVAAAWNKGLRYAFDNGLDYAIVLNSDLILHKDCIDNLVKFYELNPNIIIGTATEVNNKIDIGDHTPAVKPFSEYISDLDSLDWPNDGGSGFYCYITSKKLIEDVGYFDENFIGAYFEDNDMHWRLVNAGYGCGACTSSLIGHFTSRSIKEGGYMNSNFSRNREYFLRKHNTTDTGIQSNGNWVNVEIPGTRKR
jgi:GT2 family glycosyltransferase